MGAGVPPGLQNGKFKRTRLRTVCMTATERPVHRTVRHTMCDHASPRQGILGHLETARSVNPLNSAARPDRRTRARPSPWERWVPGERAGPGAPIRAPTPCRRQSVGARSACGRRLSWGLLHCQWCPRTATVNVRRVQSWGQDEARRACPGPRSEMSAEIPGGRGAESKSPAKRVRTAPGASPRRRAGYFRCGRSALTGSDPGGGQGGGT